MDILIWRADNAEAREARVRRDYADLRELYGEMKIRVTVLENEVADKHAERN